MVIFIVVERSHPIREEKNVESDLTRIRAVADYQFGKHVGACLFPDDVEIEHSKKTGRIRYIRLKGVRLATMRPTDGLLCLSIEGAQRIIDQECNATCFVTARNDVSEFIIKGGDVFAAHIVQADNSIHCKDEVIVLDEKRKLLAVGRAVLASEEMKAFKRGVAVKVRHGCQ